MKEDQYEYNNSLVKVAPFFIYEISIIKYEKENYEVLGQKYIKAKNILPFKSSNEITYGKGYVIEKDINLVAVPLDFIKQNNLQIYQKRKRK